MSALGKRVLARSGWLLAVLLIASGAPGQEPLPAIHGTWQATFGPARALQGRWTGHALPNRPDAGEGSWSLLSDGGRTVLEGTWAAQKTRHGWQGSWTARTLRGDELSGTWRADIEDAYDKTFRDMLEWTVQQEISGQWRSGRHAGNWRLKGSPPQP